MKIDFLHEETGSSAMRVFFILIVLLSGVLILGMAFHIIFNTVNNKDVQWAEMSVFLGGITAFTTTAAWQKVQQKKVEVQQQMHNDDNEREAAA